ncbi:MAG: hypothetical protein KJP21_09135 [Bacteroidia bacterium]|nr:hypothetical protein [Bacteroidia bacterium]NNJ54515.1 hypothetical protein [Bacteroidia bacterium]
MTFRDQLKDHLSNWLHLYRGRKQIRFGEFVRPGELSKQNVTDIENGLIFDIKPLANSSGTKSYSYKNEYIINSPGVRGGAKSG